MFTYFHFMKHCFDFKGKASRSEFYFSLVSYIFIGGFLYVCESLIWLFVFELTPELASQISLSGLLGTVAFYSLAMRRLRDAGYKETTLRWIIFPFGPTISFFVSLMPNEVNLKK